MSEYLPQRIAEIMGGRSVLDVSLDLASGVRGSRDMCLSDCANDMTVLEHYISKWTPTPHTEDPTFDNAVLACIITARNMAEDWFRGQASDIGI